MKFFVLAVVLALVVGCTTCISPAKLSTPPALTPDQETE